MSSPGAAARKGPREACHRRARQAPDLAATAANALNLVRVVLEDALERAFIRTNPARDVRLPSSVRKRPRTHKTWTYPLPDEQAKLLTAETIWGHKRGSDPRDWQKWFESVKLTRASSMPNLTTELTTLFGAPPEKPNDIEAPPTRIELVTFGLGNRCSVH